MIPRARGTFVRAALPVIAVAVVGIASAGVTASVISHRLALEDQRDVRALAATVAPRVMDAISVSLDGAERGALVPGATEFAAGDPELRVGPDVLGVARDTGRAIPSVLGGKGVIVVAGYAGDAVPKSSAARRGDLRSFRVVPFELLSVVQPFVPNSGGLLVSAPTGTLVALPDPPPRGATRFTVPLGSSRTPGWELVAWRAPRATSLLVATSVFGLLAVALALSLVVRVLTRRSNVERLSRARRERELSQVAALGSVVQQSLDLADVLPGVASHLMDGFDLVGVAVSLPAEGGERAVFATGVEPDWDIRGTVGVPDGLRSGETLAMSLSRGNRLLGVLRLVAGDDLDRQTVRTVAAAGELLGSSLANASAFAQQREVVRRLRAVDELKTVFLATASHELRTPTTAISGFAGLLAEQWDDVDPAQGRLFVERIAANAQNLEKLITDLLDFSRLERGQGPSADEILDLGVTVQRVVGELDRTGDHTITVHAPPGRIVRGSIAALERILSNLIGNAQKYSPAGTTVHVSLADVGDRVELRVDDEGPGVPPADRERVFSRFFRGSGDAVITTRGVGLGLAIVAEFAASMAATASVVEAPSGGARFTISFPIHEPATPTEGALDVTTP